MEFCKWVIKSKNSIFKSNQLIYWKKLTYIPAKDESISGHRNMADGRLNQLGQYW